MPFREALLITVSAILAGCVASTERLLDEQQGLADSSFTGRFTYELAGKNRNIQIFLKDRKYLIEEDGRLTSFATLHRLRDDILITQGWNVKRTGGDAPYIYYLLRKTAMGFEVDGHLCDSTANCAVRTQEELIRKLESQAAAFLSTPKDRLYVQRVH